MENTNRRGFLTACAGATVLSGASWCNVEGQTATSNRNVRKLDWHNPESWGVEGRGFSETKRFYDRLPARAKGVVRDAVWNLSRHSAGISTRFKTESSEIHVRYQLTEKSLAMSHMPATSVSGVDLYAKDNENKWRWVAVVKPGAVEIETRVINNMIPLPNNRLREFMLYWPLYNGVKQLELGVDAGTKFEPVKPRTEKPILFYGTSIMQGACASRSGMSISGILGRRLNRPTMNFGFSGNGRMENEVGQFLCELDPGVFVVDCLPNMDAETVSRRCAPLVRQIRAARANTPILLVADRVNTGAWIRRGAEQRHAKNRAALKTTFELLKREGVSDLFFLGHEDLLGDDHEGATDGSHPSDLGMMRYADAYEKTLRQILSI